MDNQEQIATVWHTLSGEEACARLGTDEEAGLTEAAAAQRLVHYGPNRLAEEKAEPWWEVLLEELREPTVLLLLFTGVLYSVWGKLEDAITILAVILLVAGVELFNERRAKKAIGALRKLAEPTAATRRGGHTAKVPVERIVPGDLILLEAGRRVPADARLLNAYGLAVDESLLTGESLPVEKEADVVLPAAASLAEQRNRVFAGTVITRGRGMALVAETGPATQLGHIAGLARTVKPPKTPLQKAMSELSNTLVWLALGVSVLVPLLGVLLAHQPLNTMLLTGLSLAFATIPEELPVIITLVLALGAYRLSKQRAIVKRLKAVETLGAVTVIVTDKTGTLTENQMAVHEMLPPAFESRLLTLGVLCNDASEDGSSLVGDALDAGLLRRARDAGLDVAGLRRQCPIRNEFTFENERKMMSVVCARHGRARVVAKGAPEAILAHSTRIAREGPDGPLAEVERQAWLEQSARLAAQGLRVIALAEKDGSSLVLTQAEAESDLTFVGLAGFADPPRPEVNAAMEAAHSAGVWTIMVTGDHALTAYAIASQVGLNGDDAVVTGPELDRMSEQELEQAVDKVSVYARSTPEHKLRIVQALHGLGQRVAVTGDGTNDAPALAAADIGIAMGESGTDVAREAADMVLADDNFATIVGAVEEGRALYANLKKAVRYYLTIKVALIACTLLPVLLLVPVPFAPVQIILMELFMDLCAAATFVAEQPETDLLREGPRDPKAKFMDRAMILSLFTSAAGLFAAVMVAYLTTWHSTQDLVQAQGIAFFTWMLGHVFLALNMRSEQQPLFQLGLFSNRLMVLWLVGTAAFVLLVAYVPGLQAVFRGITPTVEQWAVMVGLVLVGTFWIELRKLIAYKWKSDGRSDQVMGKAVAVSH
jgi:P-type Ca2+ transporter type 2C